jgi:hypothetical protein
MKRDGKKKSEGESKDGSMEFLSRKVQKNKSKGYSSYSVQLMRALGDE